MSRLHPARRSAERFDSLLEGEQGVTRDARDAELLELVGALRPVPRVEARPEFVADLRERLHARRRDRAGRAATRRAALDATA